MTKRNGKPFIRVLVALLLLGIAGCSASTEKPLRSAAQAGKVPRDLVVVYDDHDSVWGGERVTIRGSGALRVERFPPRGEPTKEGAAEKPSEIWNASLAPERLTALVETLVAIRAWEQRGDGPGPELDPAKATLSVDVGRERSRIWEWTQDMPALGRIGRVKAEMDRLIEATRPEAREEGGSGPN